MRGIREDNTSSKRSSEIDGRWISAGIVAGFLIAIYIAGERTDFVSAWAQVGVEHLRPTFADMRFLMTALERQRLGADPFVTRDFHPSVPPFNYPRVWLALGSLGLGEGHTVALALAVAAIFYLTMAFLVGRTTIMQGVICGVLLCSPPAMLAIERGNIDLIIFALLAIAVVLFNRKLGTYWCYVLVTLAAVLKLYPICAFAIGLRERRRIGILLLLLGLVICAVYLYCIRRDIALMFANTPQIKEISFGRRVVFQKLVSMKFHVAIETWSKMAVAGGFLLAFVASFTTKRPEFSSPAGSTMAIGAAIYAGLFVVMNNFYYRLIFLFFLLPQLFLWQRQRDQFRWVSRAVIFIMTAAMLLASARAPQYFITKEIFNWVLFVFCLFILICLARNAGSALLSRTKLLG